MAKIKSPSPQELLSFIEEELSSRNFSKEEIAEYFQALSDEGERLAKTLTDEIEDAALGTDPDPLPLTSELEEEGH